MQHKTKFSNNDPWNPNCLAQLLKQDEQFIDRKGMLRCFTVPQYLLISASPIERGSALLQVAVVQN